MSPTDPSGAAPDDAADDDAGDPRDGRAASPVRRDRRGRGMRGILLPPSAPAWRSRAERFDDAILDAVESLERRVGKKVSRIEFAVEEVPPETVDPLSRTYDDESGVPLASSWSSTRSDPARVVLYRRPIESRAPQIEDLEDFVRDLVVEQVADILGMDPDELDPPPN
ncbi:MAG: hypothetical protein QOC60_1167 [Frankiaceae bacterium]|jgi:predicted Zn-dependent protease with MMP-like domain|nr:hypothetical protein [Frankiaceae bacterium]